MKEKEETMTPVKPGSYIGQGKKPKRSGGRPFANKRCNLGNNIRVENTRGTEKIPYRRDRPYLELSSRKALVVANRDT